MKHRIKSTKAGQAYVSMRGWHKASPPRSGRDSQVGLGDTPDEDMQELQRENSDEYEADWETLSDLDDASKNLAKAVDQAVSWMGDVEPAEYDERTRRELLRGDVSDIIDAFTEVNNAIASTDWEISSRKSGKRKTTKARGNSFNSARRSLIHELKVYMKEFETAISDLENAEDADSFANAANDAGQMLEDRGLDPQSFYEVYQEFTSENDDFDTEKSRRRRTLKAKTPNAKQAVRAMAMAQDALGTFSDQVKTFMDEGGSGGGGENSDNVGIVDDLRNDVMDLRRGSDEVSGMLDDLEGLLP